MSRKLKIEEVKNKIKEIPKDNYDLSLITEYKNNRTPMPIICYKHGMFESTFDKLSRGCGCPKCAKNYKMDTDTFKEKAHQVHGDNYIYDEVDYKNTETKVKIICKKCGEPFYQTPHMHLSGQGCPNCYGNKTKTTEKYIKECRKIHNDKYIYDKTIYTNAYSKVTITCPIHGDFEQIAKVHLNGHGCPKCSGKYKYEKEYLIEKAKEIHGNKYDYSLIKEIKNNRTKQPIICPKHGVFYQTIDNHINQKQGCPKCQRSLLEEDIAKFLTENGYEYEEQKKFDWLGLQSLDFYLPKYNIAIECQGIQHIKPDGNFGSKKITKEEIYEKVCKLDDIKNELCKNNGINIIYYADTNLDYRYQICRNKNDLLRTLNYFTNSK